jgi:hypothetical protein
MNMLEIEDRIRAAARAAADTVTPDSVRPLRLAPEHPFRARAGSRSLASVWGRWLAPAAAAAAVVAVAMAMVLVGQTAHHSPGGSALPFSAPPGPVRAGPSISSYVASGRVPRYYVSIESHGNPNFNPSYAVVRATATGAAIDTYQPASGKTVTAVTADAHDRTFVLDEQPWVNPNSNANQSFEPRTFYRLTLDASGHIGALNPVSVSVPGGQLMTGFALSPDGQQLAIAVQPHTSEREPDLTEVTVITLATGATRTWTANGTIGFGPDDARSLSWAADERTLAFDWEGDGSGVHTGIWLLDLSAEGGSLLADSREAVTLINQASLGATPLPSATASPSGQEQATVTFSTADGGTATPTPSTSTSTSPSPSPSTSAGAGASAGASPTRQPATPPTCQEDSIITPDGSTIVCGAIAEIDEHSGSPGVNLQRGAETEFIEYSRASGKVRQILGHWTFARVAALSVEVLWSNASGSLLIGLIPDGGDGRIGVISGNQFTLLPVSAAASSGTW